MVMTNIADTIKAKQRSWAAERKIELNQQNRCVRLEDNLFKKLNRDAREEFEQADGSELDGHMCALHSSSALVCNVFDYWRGQDKSTLADALGVAKRITRIKFEEKFPTGVGPRSPNLDVVLFLAGDALVAIESKFTEPFGGGRKNLIQEKYFANGKKRWSQAGLPHCQKLAENLLDENYKYLDAAQLLKHMLGLANANKRQWKLLYLWFDPGGSAGEKHQKEIDHFIDAVNGDGKKVCAMTYQSLFNRLSAIPDAQHEHADYKNYLAQRYFQREKNQTT